MFIFPKRDKGSQKSRRSRSMEGFPRSHCDRPSLLPTLFSFPVTRISWKSGFYIRGACRVHLSLPRTSQITSGGGGPTPAPRVHHHRKWGRGIPELTEFCFYKMLGLACAASIYMEIHFMYFLVSAWLDVIYIPTPLLFPAEPVRLLLKREFSSIDSSPNSSSERHR